MKRFFLNKKGFLLSEMLLSLIIAVIILPITITSLKLCKEGLKFETCKQDAIAIVQLRKIFTLGNDFIVHPKEIEFNYQQEDVFLKLINKNIVLKPGTQFFFMDLDDVTFFEDSGCIWMNYARKTKENTYLLTCQ